MLFMRRGRARLTVCEVCVFHCDRLSSVRALNMRLVHCCVFFLQPMKTLPHKHFLHTDQNNCPVCPKLRMFFFLHSFIRFRSFIWCVECNNAQRLLIALLIILITHSEEFLISRLEFHNTKIH